MACAIEFGGTSLCRAREALVQSFPSGDRGRCAVACRVHLARHIVVLVGGRHLDVQSPVTHSAGSLLQGPVGEGGGRAAGRPLLV